ncbi:glycosyltransferase family 1 protein, partial [Bordetella pertussis]
HALAQGRVLGQRMGAAGRALAEREFGIEDVCRRHLAIYRALAR